MLPLDRDFFSSLSECTNNPGIRPSTRSPDEGDEVVISVSEADGRLGGNHSEEAARSACLRAQDRLAEYGMHEATSNTCHDEKENSKIDKRSEMR